MPENFNFPLQFYIEEAQEELVFVLLEANLHRIEQRQTTPSS